MLHHLNIAPLFGQGRRSSRPGTDTGRCLQCQPSSPLRHRHALSLCPVLHCTAHPTPAPAFRAENVKVSLQNTPMPCPLSTWGELRYLMQSSTGWQKEYLVWAHGCHSFVTFKPKTWRCGEEHIRFPGALVPWRLCTPGCVSVAAGPNPLQHPQRAAFSFTSHKCSPGSHAHTTQTSPKHRHRPLSQLHWVLQDPLRHCKVPVN